MRSSAPTVPTRNFGLISGSRTCCKTWYNKQGLNAQSTAVFQTFWLQMIHTGNESEFRHLWLCVVQLVDKLRLHTVLAQIKVHNKQMLSLAWPRIVSGRQVYWISGVCLYGCCHCVHVHRCCHIMQWQWGKFPFLFWWHGQLLLISMTAVDPACSVGHYLSYSKLPKYVPEQCLKYNRCHISNG